MKMIIITILFDYNEFDHKSELLHTLIQVQVLHASPRGTNPSQSYLP